MKETRTILAGAMCGVLIAGGAGAADVTLTNNDSMGASSFNTAGRWSNQQAPSAANDYWVIVSGRTLRTPDNTAADFTFAGNSLTLTNGGKILYKGITSTITIPNLTVNGGELANGNASRTWTLAGGMTVGPNGVRLTVADSNNRTIIIPDPIVGVGALDISVGALTTYGSKVVLSSDGNTYAGGTLVVPYSTLQIGNGGTTGWWGAGPLTNNGVLAFNRSDNMAISGPIFTGTGGLAQYGPNELTLNAAPASTYTGTTTLNGGTLVLGADLVLGTGTLDLRGGITRAIDGNTRTVTNALSISANIVLGSAGTGDLVFSGPVNNGGQAKQVTISNAVTTFASFSNTGVLTIQGPGVFKLAADADIPNSSSITVAAGGTFDVSATTGGFTNRAGKAFAGAGTIEGDFTVSGNLSPGVSGPGTLTFNDNLNLAVGTLNFDLANVGTAGGGVNDLLDVAGNLAASGISTVNVYATSSSFAPTYTLIAYDGTLTGDASYFTIGNAAEYRQTLTVNTDTANEIRLLVSGSGANLTWSGGYGTAWDIRTTTNWNTDTEMFYPTDTVKFDDTGATNDVVLGGTLRPSAVLVDASQDYTFQGAGKISGSGGLVKTGTGMLTISTANDYTGGTAISNGILRAGNATALGVGGDTVIAADGTLDIGGVAMYNRTGGYTIIGDGYNSTGAVINSGGEVQNAIRSLRLAGDAMVATWPGRWDIRSPNAAYNVDQVDLNGYTLTKQGDGRISIVNQVMTNNGTLEIAAGQVWFTRSIVTGNGAINLSPGTTLGFENNHTTGVYTKAISATGATFRLVGNSLALGGPVTMNSSDNIVNVDANLTFTLGNTVSGAGSWAKIGAGTLELAGNNDFSGAVTVSNGTLRMNGANASMGLLTVASNGVLSGVGSVAGVTVQDYGHLAPGNTPGTLTVSGPLTLSDQSILDFELDAPNAATGGNGSDFVTGVNGLTLDGVLNITALAGFTTTDGSKWRLIQFSGTVADNGLAIGTAPALGAEQSYVISTDAEALYVAIIPEPGSVGLLLMGAIVALFRRRRRWR